MAKIYTGNRIHLAPLTVGTYVEFIRDGNEYEGVIRAVRHDNENIVLVKAYHEAGLYQEVEDIDPAVYGRRYSLFEVARAHITEVVEYEANQPIEEPREERWDCERCGARDQKVVSRHIVNRQDPTEVIKLACGHTMI